MSSVVPLSWSDIPKLRADLLADQGGVCLICKRPPARPVLDHHHTKRIRGTGRVRGVICSACNVFLAKIENNAVRYGIAQSDIPRILRSIVVYLGMPMTRYLHPSERPKPRVLSRRSFAKLIRRLNETTTRGRLPEYPNRGRLTKKIARLYKVVGLVPEFKK